MCVGSLTVYLYNIMQEGPWPASSDYQITQMKLTQLYPCIISSRNASDKRLTTGGTASAIAGAVTATAFTVSTGGLGGPVCALALGAGASIYCRSCGSCDDTLHCQ